MGFNETLKNTFPDSITIAQLIKEIDRRVSRQGVDHSSVKPAIALCRDDSTHELIRALDARGYPPSFKMNSLAAMPVYGIDSVGAWYHHIPDKGAGVIIYGPHIGLDSKGNLGQLDRHGKSDPGKSCGANHALLERWARGDTGPYEKSPELTEVSRMLSGRINDILKSSNPILSLVETEYTITNKAILDYVTEIKSKEHHKYPILLIGGIHIDIGTGNRFHMRDIHEL